MHAYRTHTCGALRATDAGKTVRLSGWVHRKRDHGQLLFIDLRDHYGLTQCVVDAGPARCSRRPTGCGREASSPSPARWSSASADTVNPACRPARIELRVRELTCSRAAEPLPLQVAGEAEFPRGHAAALPLPRPAAGEACTATSSCARQVIASIRRRMIEQGFTEFQTPILTASSRRRARATTWCRAACIPASSTRCRRRRSSSSSSLMVAGFDRYFQIAPCFRDEDGRADRTPGEFYQLDFEMSFVTQEDVFAAIEPVLHGVFEEFADFSGTKRAVTPAPFPRIPYDDVDAEIRHRQAGPAQPAASSPT